MGAQQSREKTINPSLPSDTPKTATALPEPNFSTAIKAPNTTTGEDSSEDEKESFRGWLSASTSDQGSMSSSGTKRRPSATYSGTPFQQPQTPNASASSSHDMHSVPSSSNWIGQRPSVDTPLRSPSLAAPPEKQGSIVASGDHAGQQRGPSLGHDSYRSSDSSTDRKSGQHSTTNASVRSSFALERASLEANRYSLEAFQEAYRSQGKAMAFKANNLPNQALENLEDVSSEAAGASLDLLLKFSGLRAELRDPLAALCVLPSQTPAPASMLARLWKLSYDKTLMLLKEFASSGVLNIAVLPNGETWALPQPQPLQLVQSACQETCVAYHSRLLDAYLKSADGSKSNITSITDDGYIVANIGHHLIGARRISMLQSLLLDPAWLDKKLVACGPGAVVADFRRYLLINNERDVKVVLEAFQMSVGLVASHRPAGVPGLLRCLISGRLMTVPLSPKMQTWLLEQREAVRREGAEAMEAGLPRCLPPTTPSLDQAGGLQRLTLKGHKGPVRKVLITPSGTEAISASSDGCARLWDLEIGDCVLSLDGHAGPITDMALSADGSLLVTSSEDGTARAHELERGQCLRVLSGHNGPIASMAMDPFGRFVATGGSDGTVRIFDLGSARALHVLAVNGEVCSLTLSPCTRYALAGCSNGTVYLFDVISGQIVGLMEGHVGRVSVVRFLPEKNRVLSASNDGTLRLWSIRTGRCVRVYQGHSGRVNDVAVSEDGSTFISASDDGTLHVWSTKSEKCRLVLKGHRGWVSGVVLSRDNDRVVSSSGDGTAICWSLDAGEPLLVLEGHSGPVWSAALTHRGRFAVTASEDGSVRVWDFNASSGHTPKWHEGRIHALAASDGIVVATAGDDCVARIWDATLGEYRGILKGHSVPIRWAIFSSDGSELITASPDREVRMWDMSTLEMLHRLPSRQGSRMKCFAASAENLHTVCICLFDGSVMMYDVRDGRPTVTLQARGIRDEAHGHTSAVNEVLISGNGSRVVTLSKDSTARVWDAVSGTCLQVLRGHEDVIVGGHLADEGCLATYSFDRSVRLWDLTTGKCLAKVPLDENISKLAVSKCGWRIACALMDGSVVLCDVKKGKEEGCIRLRWHSDDITAISFSSDGNLLATSSMDCTLRLMDFASGSLQGMFISDCGLTCCHFDSVTEYIVAGTDRGVVHFIDASVPAYGKRRRESSLAED